MMNFNASQWRLMKEAVELEDLLGYGSYQVLMATNPVNGVSVKFAEILTNEELNRFAVFTSGLSPIPSYLVGAKDQTTLSAIRLLNAAIEDQQFLLNAIPGCDQVVLHSSSRSSMVTGESRTISSALEVFTECFDCDHGNQSNEVE